MEFNMKYFYMIMVACFSASAIGNIINLKYTWNLMNLGGKISGISGLVFNIFLVIVGIVLYKSVTKQNMNLTPEVEALLEKYANNKR